MKDQINVTVLNELKEYAQLYFEAIVECNTENGACKLRPGKYSASELSEPGKALCGFYKLPEDKIFDETVNISAGAFKCAFRYRDIFIFLRNWEVQIKAGRAKAVFEIGAVEEKTAKALINEKTELGAYKTKGTKMQRITGNWWMPKKIKKHRPIELYYELNGVMFTPGKQVWSDKPTDPQTVKWCERFNDEEISKLLLSFLNNDREQTQKNTPYYAEIVNRAKIPTTPSEMPQKSTEATETVNVSAEGENAEKTLEMQSERKITYFHHTPEQLRRYIIDVYEKRANGEWVLLPYAQIDTDAGLWDVVDGKIGWWTNWRREEFSEMNMDFNSPTCGRCCKINRTYQTDNYVISNEKLLEFTLNGDYYYIQRQIYSKGGIKECYTIMDALGDFSVNDYSDTLDGIMQRFDKYYKERATIIWQSPEFAPQSPETPQTVECITDTPKPRETARKPQNRGIGSTQRSRRSGLGAGGYVMRDNASATLDAMSVPRECSTIDAAYW